MFKLSDSTRVTSQAGATWKTCARCGTPFPGAPEQSDCRDCVPDAAECSAGVVLRVIRPGRR